MFSQVLKGLWVSECRHYSKIFHFMDPSPTTPYFTIKAKEAEGTNLRVVGLRV